VAAAASSKTTAKSEQEATVDIRNASGIWSGRKLLWRHLSSRVLLVFAFVQENKQSNTRAQFFFQSLPRHARTHTHTLNQMDSFGGGGLMPSYGPAGPGGPGFIRKKKMKKEIVYDGKRMRKHIVRKMIDPSNTCTTAIKVRAFSLSLFLCFFF
jgi:hypothetical protein